MSQKKLPQDTKEAGFSMVELVIAATITGIISTILLHFFTARLQSVARNETLTILQSNTKRAIETLERDIKSARSVENTNTLSDPYGTIWSSSADVVALSVPSRNASGGLIYIDPLHNAIYTDNIILFVEPSSKILYKRVIANSAAPGNASVTTCRPSDVPGVCNRADIQVVEDVADLDLAYYTSASTLIDLASGGQPAQAGAVQLTLAQIRTKAGNTYRSSFSSLVSLRNK